MKPKHLGTDCCNYFSSNKLLNSLENEAFPDGFFHENFALSELSGDDQ